MNWSTPGAACGYTDLTSMGYNHDTAALSTALFNNGSSCGQCYKIVCDYKSNPQYCLQGASIVITATNFCPPNYKSTITYLVITVGGATHPANTLTWLNVLLRR